MPEVKLHRVRINWTGPFSLDQVVNKFKARDKDRGLYQVYGHHVVYGPRVLLYVGRTIKKTFSARFKQHRQWLLEENNIEIRLGRLCAEDYINNDDWKKLVEEIEALTIYYHSPAYNSSSVSNYKRSDIDLLVQNWGDMGSLLPEYTNLWTNPSSLSREISAEEEQE